jgi:hypothetical protein
MALTPEEQTELDQLTALSANDQTAQQVTEPAQQVGLSDAEEQELAQLQDDELQSSVSLIEALTGKLPSSQLPPERRERVSGSSIGFGGVGIGSTGLAGVTEPNPRFGEEVTRRKAFQSLTEQGFGSKQIQTVLDIQSKINPGLLESLKQNAGQEVGGLAGAAAGAKLALALGQMGPQAASLEELVTVPIGAIAGAFIGGGLGKTTQQAIDPLESVSARDFLKAGAIEAGFEAGGRAIRPVARGIGFGKKTSTPVEVAKERFKLADGFFAPAQRDPRISIRAADQLSRGSFGGGPIMAAHNLAQQGQAVEIGQDIIKRVAGEALDDPAVLGDELAGIFTRLGEKGQQVSGVRQTLLDTFFDDLYKQVDELSPGAKFTTEPIKKFAQSQLDENIKLGGALLTGEGKSRMAGILKSLPDEVSANEMRKLRSLYAADARRFQIGGDQSSRGFSKLAEVSDDILFDEGSQAGLTGPARKLLRNINAVYGPSKQLYNEEVVKEVVRKLNTKPGLVNSIIGKNPDPKKLKTIRELLISPIRKVSGSGKSTKTITKEFRTARRALKNPAAKELISKNTAEGKRLWRQLRASWLQENIVNKQTGLIDAKQIDKALKGMSPESFKIMFPGEVGKDLRTLNGLVDVISPEKGGLATLFGKGIEFSGAGAIGSGLAAGSGARIIKGGLLTIGPTLYAKIATNPKATKVLTLGLKRQIKGKLVNVPALTARIINALREQDLADQKAIRKERRRILSAPARREIEASKRRDVESFRGVPGLKF